MKNKELKRVTLLSIAAMVISLTVLFMAVIILLRTNQRYITEEYMDIQVVAGEDVRKEVTMTDNSKVWLNANSTLKYAPDYRVDRRVHIIGEAYMKVSTYEKMFTLTLDEMTLFTYGAALLVNNNPDKGWVRIALYSGELGIGSSDWAKSIAMDPGTELLLDRKTGEIRVNRITPHVQGPEWVVHTFEYVTFSNILYTLSQYYDVEVVNHRPDLNNEPFSLTCDGNMTLDQVMQIMKAISNKFTYHITDNELIIN